MADQGEDEPQRSPARDKKTVEGRVLADTEAGRGTPVTAAPEGGEPSYTLEQFAPPLGPNELERNVVALQ